MISLRYIFTIAAILLSTHANAVVAEPQVSFHKALIASPFGEAGKKHGISPYLLYAIALVESAKSSSEHKGYVSPSQYAIRSTALGAVYPKNREQAEKQLQRHMQEASNLKQVDVCAMQVNLGWNGGLVSEPSELLDLNVCIDTGARILKEALRSTRNLYLAIGRYHRWDDEEAAINYAVKVISRFNNLPRD